MSYDLTIIDVQVGNLLYFPCGYYHEVHNLESSNIAISNSIANPFYYSTLFEPEKANIHIVAGITGILRASYGTIQDVFQHLAIGQDIRKLLIS